MASLETSALVRREIENVYWCTKQGILPMAHGKELTAILKTLAGVIFQEKQVEVDEQIAELRAAIEGLKQHNEEMN